MKPLITLLPGIIGGINWASLACSSSTSSLQFGGQRAVLARVVYILVGASAVWQLIPLTKAFGSDEPFALRGH